jgi:hypothetical protein
VKSAYADIPAVSRGPAATIANTSFAPRAASETTTALADLGLGAAIAATTATAAVLHQDPEPESTPAEDGEDTASKVSDLEREMARLLGEITAKRS